MEFCPRCGARGTRGMLCANCRTTEEQVFRGKEIVATLCTGCQKMAVRNRWVPYRDRVEIAMRAVQMSMPDLQQREILDATIGELPGPGMKRDVTITAMLDGTPYEFPARVITTLCPNCSKHHTKYFEGILQLRNPRPEIIVFIKSDVAKQRDRGIYISEEHPEGNGVDFRLTSQRYLQGLG